MFYILVTVTSMAAEKEERVLQVSLQHKNCSLSMGRILLGAKPSLNAHKINGFSIIKECDQSPILDFTFTWSEERG